jgi:hypothetical protein
VVGDRVGDSRRGGGAGRGTVARRGPGRESGRVGGADRGAAPAGSEGPHHDLDQPVSRPVSVFNDMADIDRLLAALGRAD